jgi:hypothetical protein
MRITIDLPDDLFRQAKVRAALDGVTLENLVTRFVEQGLRQDAHSAATPPRRQRSELPVAREATGRILELAGTGLWEGELDDVGRA